MTSITISKLISAPFSVPVPSSEISSSPAPNVCLLESFVTKSEATLLLSVSSLVAVPTFYILTIVSWTVGVVPDRCPRGCCLHSGQMVYFIVVSF